MSIDPALGKVLEQHGSVRATLYGPIDHDKLMEVLSGAFSKETSQFVAVTRNDDPGKVIAFIGNTPNSPNIGLAIEALWNWALETYQQT